MVPAGRRARVRRRRPAAGELLPARRPSRRSGSRCGGRSRTASGVRFADLPATHGLAIRQRLAEPEEEPERIVPATAGDPRRRRPDHGARPRGRVRRPRALVGGRRRAPHATSSWNGSRRSRTRWPRCADATAHAVVATTTLDGARRTRGRRGGDAPGASARGAEGRRRADRRRVRRLPRTGAGPGDLPAGQRTTTACCTGCPRPRSRPPGRRGPSDGWRYASGYGAGVTSPGWYQHLFEHWARSGRRQSRDRRWLVRVARELRDEGLDASTASVVEAARLADAAGRRTGPAVGRSRRARRRGRVGAVRRLRAAAARSSTTGSSSARSSARVPESRSDRPARRGPRARLQRAAAAQAGRRRADHVTLDLRTDAQPGPIGAAAPAARCSASPGARRPTPGARPAPSRRAGSSSWTPELAVAVIEAGLFGTTVAGAAVAKVARARRARRPTSPTLGRAGHAVPAGRPARGAARRGRRARRAHGPAARRPRRCSRRSSRWRAPCRYGDVRGVDTAEVRAVLDETCRPGLGRPAAPPASASTTTAAAAVRARLEAAHRGLSLARRRGARAAAGRLALRRLADRDRMHGRSRAARPAAARRRPCSTRTRWRRG